MSNARNLARLIVDSGGDVDVSSLGNVPPSNDASALTTGTLPIARLAANAITADKLGVGKYIKQMKHGRRDSAFYSSTNDAIAQSLQFDNPVTIGNQILVFASGTSVSGTGNTNWGSGLDIFLDDVRLSSNLWTNGAQYYAFGAPDIGGSVGGSPFGLMAIGTATVTNPTATIRTHTNTGWTWHGLNYSFNTYGHASSNMVIIEFGV